MKSKDRKGKGNLKSRTTLNNKTIRKKRSANIILFLWLVRDLSRAKGWNRMAAASSQMSFYWLVLEFRNTKKRNSATARKRADSSNFPNTWPPWDFLNQQTQLRWNLKAGQLWLLLSCSLVAEGPFWRFHEKEARTHSWLVSDDQRWLPEEISRTRPTLRYSFPRRWWA